MALVLADRVRDTTTTTGTGTVTLSGTAPTGYQTFGSAIGNANTTYYTINAGSQWEVGIGTYSSTGPTLSRDTVLASSSAGAAVDFAVGTKDVFVTYPAEKSVNYDASNNVGIGTTAPAYKADIAGIVNTSQSFRMGASYFGSASDYFISRYLTNMVYNVPTGSGFVWGIAGGDTMLLSSSGNLGIGTSSPTAGAGYTSISLRNSTGGNIDLGVGSTIYGQWLATSSASRLLASNGAYQTFEVGGTERVRIDTSGNVGIGTASPGFKLDVSGDAHTSGSVFMGSNADGWGRFVNSGGALYIQAGSLNSGSATAQPIIFTNMYGGSERMRITAAGNVGIGTSAPAGPLHVVADTNSSLLIRGPITYGTGASLFAVNAANTVVAPMELAASAFFFNAGNVGVGNSNVAPKFSVTLTTGFSWGGGWGAGSAVFGGNGTASGAGSGGVGITYDDTDGGTIGPVIPGVAWKPLRLFSDTLQLYTNGATERMRITSGGVVQVNTTSTPTFGSPKLIVDGGISGKGTVTINSSTATTIAEGAGMLLLIRNNTHGGTAVVQYENAVTPIIIATSGGTTFQTGTPSGSAQIQLTNRSGNLGVAALASGDRNGASLSVTILQAFT